MWRCFLSDLYFGQGGTCEQGESVPPQILYRPRPCREGFCIPKRRFTSTKRQSRLSHANTTEQGSRDLASFLANTTEQPIYVQTARALQNPPDRIPVVYPHFPSHPDHHQFKKMWARNHFFTNSGTNKDVETIKHRSPKVRSNGQILQLEPDRIPTTHPHFPCHPKHHHF